MTDLLQLGARKNPLRVAIVGSGPSGFYAADELLQCGRAVEVSMIERLPVPFGLVRSGVAPDHPKLKQTTVVFDRIAHSASFRYFGNVRCGCDVTLADLDAMFHAVILACGSESERRLGIAGEDLPGSHAGTDFVGWYNGHPDHAGHRFDLSREAVVIVGQGNVALDLARMLAKSADALRHTDIAQHALESLAQSRVRDIHIVGRRGPAQARFTPSELMELGKITGCDVLVDEAELTLNEASLVEAGDKMSRNVSSNLGIFKKFAASRGMPQRRCCHFHFLLNPVGIEGAGNVERVCFERTRLEGEPFKQAARPTGEFTNIECGLVFRSIGYKGTPLPGVPFDEAQAVVPNRAGRVIDVDGGSFGNVYVTGWIKRGPSGIIGTNKADSMETIATLLTDLPGLPQEPKLGADGLARHLERRGHAYVDYADWKKIDEYEISRGMPAGKPREKLVVQRSMLEVAGKSSA